VRFTFRLLPRNAAACALFAVALLTAYSQDAPTQETHGTVVANMDRSVKRLSPKQRSLLELLQYLVFMPEVHMRAALADSFSLDGFQTAWQAGEATAKAMNLAQITEAIGRQRALIEELLSPCSDADLRAQIEMFGNKASRGSKLVLLVLSHYAAYRMQLFLYLKAAGRAELSTFNLWLGADALP